MSDAEPDAGPRAQGGEPGSGRRPWRSFVRVKPLVDGRAIAGQTRHAARIDEGAKKRRRADADPACLAVGWREGIGAAYIEAAPERDPGDPPAPIPPVADWSAAVEEYIRETGARQRRRQPRAHQVIVGVSPGWLEETGGRHDPDNPRVRQLATEAWRWAADAWGPDAVRALRMDLDEEGAGVVDLLIVPVRHIAIGAKRKDGSLPEPQPWIAPATALAEIAARHDMPRWPPGKALQTSWHEWAQERLDARIERGVPSAITRRRHLPPDEYSARVEELKRQAEEMRAGLATLQATSQALHSAAAQIQAAAEHIILTQDDLPADTRATLDEIVGTELPDLPALQIPEIPGGAEAAADDETPDGQGIA